MPVKWLLYKKELSAEMTPELPTAWQLVMVRGDGGGVCPVSPEGQEQGARTRGQDCAVRPSQDLRPQFGYMGFHANTPPLEWLLHFPRWQASAVNSMCI